MQEKTMTKMNVQELLKKTISILKLSPLTFLLLTITFIFPLSIAKLSTSYIMTHLLLLLLHLPKNLLDASLHQWLILFLVELLNLFYLLFLSILSMLTTTATMITVTSLHTTSKPVSFSSVISAFPRVLFNNMVIILVTIPFFAALALVTCFYPVATISDFAHHPLHTRFFITIVFLFIVLLTIGCIVVLCHIVTVVLVVREGIQNLGVLLKRCVLVEMFMLMGFCLGYIFISWMINGVFSTIVVLFPQNYPISVQILVGVLLLGVYVIVNFVWLVLGTTSQALSNHQQIVLDSKIAACV